MCSRFQFGSNSPLANRRARMLSTDSLPRKWSMRKICDSSKTWCSFWFRSRAEARSVPNGFSMMTREPAERSIPPIIATTDSNADGGIARWNRRRGEPPISFSASLIALASGAVLSGSALPNDRFAANASQASPSGLLVPNCSAAWRACSRNASVLRANCAGAEPMIRYFSGISPATARWKSPGRSLRLARSPVAPNSTMT